MNHDRHARGRARRQPITACSTGWGMMMISCRRMAAVNPRSQRLAARCATAPADDVNAPPEIAARHEGRRGEGSLLCGPMLNVRNAVERIGDGSVVAGAAEDRVAAVVLR